MSSTKGSNSSREAQQLTPRDWSKATRELQNLSVRLTKIQASGSKTSQKKS
jgi:hypothetical protein